MTNKKQKPVKLFEEYTSGENTPSSQIKEYNEYTNVLIFSSFIFKEDKYKVANSSKIVDVDFHGEYLQLKTNGNLCIVEVDKLTDSELEEIFNINDDVLSEFNIIFLNQFNGKIRFFDERNLKIIGTAVSMNEINNITELKTQLGDDETKNTIEIVGNEGSINQLKKILAIIEKAGNDGASVVIPIDVDGDSKLSFNSSSKDLEYANKWIEKHFYDGITDYHSEIQKLNDTDDLVLYIDGDE